MADLSSLLAVLEHDPDDARALEALASSARESAPDVRASRFAAARKTISGRGRPDVVLQLLDAELGATGDVDHKIDLLLEKGLLLDTELLDVTSARAAFEEITKLRPDDPMAKEALEELDLAAANWTKFADKFLKEAKGSTDRSLATGLYLSAAEAFVRFAPDSIDAEAHLRKALEIDPRNSKAAFHLVRMFRRAQRWSDLGALLEQRAELAPTTEEKVASLILLADVARTQLGPTGAARADAALKRVLQLDPAQPQALRTLTDTLNAAQDWPALVQAYSAALKARREDDIGMLLQISMILWKHLNQLDQAEEFFRRVRKLEPAHPAALDFYRAYYPAKGQHDKLLALLRQVEKSSPRPMGIEIAELAESQNNPEKAIEAWKQVLRSDGVAPSDAAQARAALARLYRRTEKWNALLDLMKDELERIPEADVAARVAKLHEVVEIYRDRLRLDVMVINTYNAILKLDPENRRATDELAAKFRGLGRWNDLIAVLARKADAPDLVDSERLALLREIADLWAERFGNFANAIRPLERILEIAPGSPEGTDALVRLKEIYTKRRQWRALIDVLGREASVLPTAEKRAKQGEMARLAAERLGDTRLAIEIYNGILTEAGPDHPETLVSLASLYEREKRWLPLAEILHRQVAALVAQPGQDEKRKEALALLEKLGQIYADRAHAPSAAATVWQQILELEPGHQRALRTLRELYATAGDFAGLEALYKRIGQESELVDALLVVSDRIEDKTIRLPLVQRAAELAQAQAEAAATADPSGPTPRKSGRTARTSSGDLTPADLALEKARSVWERVLSVDPTHLGAAAALAPIYARQEKWARLLAMHEIELAAAPDAAARLAKVAQIRELCEHKLASKSLAFTWTLRAFDLEPANKELFAEAQRLASDPEQWREVATLFEKHAGEGSALPAEKRLELVRELARIAARRLNDPERARGYHRRVLELATNDAESETHLEELAIQLADWPELLASYRRRAARAQDDIERASLYIEIASLQEEKLVDLDGAAQTYHEALALLAPKDGRASTIRMGSPGYLRALRALARIEEARGDWESLAEALDAELMLGGVEGQPRFDLLMRLGTLAEQNLDKPARALRYYTDALAMAPVRPQAVSALARFIMPTGPGTKLSEAERTDAARLVLPHVEAARNFALHAQALEVLRVAETANADERLAHNRALMRLYHTDLGDPAAAWQAGLRVLAVDPADRDVRRSLGVLAGQLGRDGEWARHLATALDTLRGRTERSQTSGHLPARDDQRAIATELARLATDRLADTATAERAWKSVLELEADAPDAFDALAEVYRGTQRWPELRALLERRIEVTLDDTARRATLLELAALEEDILSDAPRAIAAHRRVLEADPSYAASYAALDRLFTAAEKWPELEELLARQVGHAKSPRDQVALGFRRAELFAHKLDDAVTAVDLLEDVIAKQRSHADGRELLEELMPKPEVTLRVARLLEPLYEQDKLWKDLVGVLRAQRTLATGTEAVELLARIATIEEAELSGARNAFDAWIEVLALDPTHERARTEIARLAQQLQRWPDATKAFELASNAAPPGDVATRSALLAELATAFDTPGSAQLGDTQRAIAAYRRWLDTDPANPATVRRAGAALVRLYEQTQSWPELRGVLRKQSEWIEDPGERRNVLARVAGLETTELNDRAAAIATWRDILADHPMDPGALDALEPLYEAADKWRDLIDILRRKVDLGLPAQPLLARIAEIHEVILEEPDEAIAINLELLDRAAPGAGVDRRALAELARLYRAAGRHADLLDILEREIAAEADADKRIATQIEIAKLLAGPLLRPADALDRWAAVLEADPEHEAALAAVEGALDDPELRLTAAGLLQPVYEATARSDKLAALYERQADWTDDITAKLRALAAVVRIREYQLDDKRGAFAAQLVMLGHAATEPELPQVLADTDRLADELGAEGELIDAYMEVAPAVLDSEIQRRLYLDVADLARAVRKDLPLAREYYQRVLDGQPDDSRALAALESIYRETNDDEKLTEILLRQSDMASADVEDRVRALVEAAALYTKLARPDDAIQAWEQVLALAPERRDAVQALESLYREQGRWPDVVDLYERRLGFATTVEEAVGLQVQLGEIHEKHLRDFETAIDNFSAALSGDPRNAVALAAVERYLVDPDLRPVAADVLEPIYVGQQRWHDLIKVYEARLDSASEPRERLRLTRFVARLYEEQLEDFENASRWYAKVFREAPGDSAIRDQLARLAQMIDNWPFVAETYQRFLEEEEGESPELRDVAVTLGAIYDRKLNDADRAAAAYRRALAMIVEAHVPPTERELVGRLEDVLGRAGKYDVLVEVYDDLIARADDEQLRREAVVARARLLERGLGDVTRAIEAWREVLDGIPDTSDPSGVMAYREAVGELERMYSQRGQWRDVVDLYEARLARSQHPNETAELRLQLATLFENQLAELGSAIDQYEHVIAEGSLWERAVSALERLVTQEDYRERIIELLEPVYREQDWWQKLVVILDAKLAYIRDPLEKVTVLQEIASLHEQRGGALELALAALGRAWRIDVADETSLTRLLALALKLGAWDEVTATLEEGAVQTQEPELAAQLWAKAAELHESQRGDAEKAIACWRQVTSLREDDVIALAALDRLLAAQGRTQELVSVVARRAELTDDGAVRLVLLHRVAALYEDVLGEPTQAIAAYKGVLGVDDTDRSALDALDRLYRAALTTTDHDARIAAARELASVLERKIELSTDVELRQALRHAAAQVYEHQLADTYQAIGQLVAVLDDDAGEQRALAELDRIYTAQKLWSELLDIIDRRALLQAVQSDRADLAYRAAHLVEVELVDPDAAIPRYSAVLTMAPAHPAARAALESLMRRDELVEPTTTILERLYRTDRDAAGLIRVYERRLAANVGDRAADWAALAETQETLAGNPAAAFEVWSRAIAAEPDDVQLLAPLLRIAENQGLWAPLAERLTALLETALPPEVDQTYAMRLGEIAEDKLADLVRAAHAFERASGGPEPRPALSALERVFARSSQWKELADVRRRQADSTDDDGQIAGYLFALGDLQESTLHDTRAAVSAYREVIGILPGHSAARASLDRILLAGVVAPEIRTEIIETLEPLYEGDGDAARLVGVLEARLALTEDTLDKATLLGRILELTEQRLADRGRALDAALRWLAVDPGPQALGEVERLAESLGQWPEVAPRLAAIVDAPGAVDREPDTQVALLVALGRIQRARLGQLDEAAHSYRRALSLEPSGEAAAAALDELITILRQRGDQSALAEALARRGALASEPAEKRAAFSEVAQLAERSGDRTAAIAAWREVVDSDELDREALGELARLYRLGTSADDRAELVDVLTRAANMVSSAVEEKTLRVEIAQLESETPRAVNAWQAVVDLDQDDLSALSALQAAHGRLGDWMAVADIQTRRLSLARSSWDKVAIHAEMAQVAELKRNSIDDAVASWFAALDVDNAHIPGYDELERLLAAGSRWHDLVELLERRAELHATLGDGGAEIASLARAADVWEGRLDNPDAAGEILEKILAREPGSVAALTRLSKIYERNGDWDKCKSTLEQALRLQPTGRDAADLFVRLGEVARVGDRDPDTAIQHYKQALVHDPQHAASIAALETLARDRKDDVLLADMLERRVAAAGHQITSAQLDLLVEIAELERKAGRDDAALAALARAANAAPNDARVLGPLADLFFATDRLDEAAPIYDQLAEEAKTARRMKDVARYRQRQGSILEARGNVAGALAAYEEALRVNPTDVATMAGLGRLYFQSKDWEKARKIYQSLVLQNLDAQVSLTKGEIYWSLGQIHLALDQGPKAKSMFQRGLELEPANEKLKLALAALG